MLIWSMLWKLECALLQCDREICYFVIFQKSFMLFQFCKLKKSRKLENSVKTVTILCFVVSLRGSFSQDQYVGNFVIMELCSEYKSAEIKI